MKLLDICSTVTAVSAATISAMAAIAAIVGAIWLSIITFAPQPILITDVALPPSLVQRGFTTTIMARRLSDEVERLSHSSARDRVEAVLFERMPDAVLSPLKPAANEGLWEPVVQVLRAFSGNRPQTISGEIVEQIGATAVPLYEGRLRLGDVLISDRKGVLASNSLDALIHDMAFDVYRGLDPTRAAYVAWTLGDLNAMRLALRPVLALSDIDPSSAPVLFLLADLELKHGDLAAAEDHVLRGLGKKPRHPLGLHRWGRILHAKGLFADAIAVAAEACRLDMQSASGCSLLGELHLEQAVLAGGNPRQFRQAYRAFARALSVDESNEDALAGAAHAAAASGDFPEALRLIDIALAKAPQNAGHLLRKTWIMFRGGDRGYAGRLLSELLNKNPNFLVTQFSCPATNQQGRSATQAGSGPIRRQVKSKVNPSRFDLRAFDRLLHHCWIPKTPGSFAGLRIAPTIAPVWKHLLLPSRLFLGSETIVALRGQARPCALLASGWTRIVLVRI